MPTFAADPYPWPYNGDWRPDNTAIIVIDMQTDFCGKGGYVHAMGYDLSLTRAPIEPIRALLEAARAKAPDLDWVQGDLTDPELDFGRAFDVVVMAGNVLIFVPTGSEARVLADAARWLAPTGRLVAGYSLRPGGFGPDEHDDLAARCGLVLEDRWSTWDRRPFGPGDNYAVSVHRRDG